MLDQQQRDNITEQRAAFAEQKALAQQKLLAIQKSKEDPRNIVAPETGNIGVKENRKTVSEPRLGLSDNASLPIKV